MRRVLTLRPFRTAAAVSEPSWHRISTDGCLQRFPALTDVAAQTGRINPDGYQYNCVICALTTDDVLAGRSGGRAAPDITRHSILVPQVEDILRELGGKRAFPDGYSFGTWADVATAIAKKLPEGRRGIVTVTQEHTNEAHLFNYMTLRGDAIFIDSQVPVITTDLVSYLQRLNYSGFLTFDVVDMGSLTLADAARLRPGTRHRGAPDQSISA